MKTDRKRLFSLIRADLIMMNGGKNSLKLLVVILCLTFGAMTYIAPFMAIYCKIVKANITQQKPIAQDVCFVCLGFIQKNPRINLKK